MTAPKAVRHQGNRQTGISKSVYFHDVDLVAEIEGLALQFPHGSFSSIMNQLAKALVEANEKKQDDGRKIHIEADIYL